MSIDSGEKEAADVKIIADCFSAVAYPENQFLHLIVVSADKDFHNLFTSMRKYPNVRTHCLSKQVRH
jgi:predicted nuclease of predicted toxin-antitoxin system